MILFFHQRLVESSKQPIIQYILLAFITVLAGVLRFYKLGEWSFWGDEMFTVGGREDGFNYSPLRSSISSALIQMTVASLGVNEWNARLIPAFVGVASVPILFFLVKRVFKAKVALVFALLLAISPWHLYWSQNARFYVPLLLFYSGALLTFYIGFEEDRPWYLIISMVCLGLAAKERLLALFLVPVVIGYLFLLIILPFEKPSGLRWRNVVLFFLPGMVVGSLLVAPYVQDLSGWMAGFGYANNDPVWILAGVVYYVGIPTICFATVGALYFLVQHNRASLLLALSAVVPLLIIMSIAPFHYTANRYIFISLTSWLILAALAMVELLSQSQSKVRILALGGLLLLILGPLGENVLYFHYQNGNRDNWKGAFELVRSQREADDLVIVANPELGDYYLRDDTVALSQVDLTSLEQNRARVWFVEDMVAHEVFPEVHHWFAENANLVAVLDVRVQARNFIMRVYLYEPEEKKLHYANQ